MYYAAKGLELLGMCGIVVGFIVKFPKHGSQIAPWCNHLFWSRLDYRKVYSSIKSYKLLTIN